MSYVKKGEHVSNAVFDDEKHATNLRIMGRNLYMKSYPL